MSSTRLTPHFEILIHSKRLTWDPGFSTPVLFFLQSKCKSIAARTDKKQSQEYGSNSNRPQHQRFIANAEIIEKIQAEKYAQYNAGNSKKIAEQQADRAQRLNQQNCQP